MEDFVANPETLIGDSAQVETEEVSPVALELSDLDQLHQLEERSYQYALVAGEAEGYMWLALKAIRDGELWRCTGAKTLDEYLMGWMLEVRNRAAAAAKQEGKAVPALPFSLSYAQKKLAIGRRMVDFFGCPPERVLTAPLQVMNAFMVALADAWDYKGGYPKSVKPAASIGLDKLHPADTLKEQVQAAVETITALPPGEAMEYIKENFTPPAQVDSYEYRVTVFKQYPLPRVRITRYNAETGDMQPGEWLDWTTEGGWPDDAILALCKKLGAGEPRYPEVDEPEAEPHEPDTTATSDSGDPV